MKSDERKTALVENFVKKQDTAKSSSVKSQSVTKRYIFTGAVFILLRCEFMCGCMVSSSSVKKKHGRSSIKSPMCGWERLGQKERESEVTMVVLQMKEDIFFFFFEAHTMRLYG